MRSVAAWSVVLLAFASFLWACSSSVEPTPSGQSPDTVPEAPERISQTVTAILVGGTPSDETATQPDAAAASWGCLGCHSTDGSILVGPSWKALFGKTEEFESGGPVVVDEAYLRESIAKPGAKVVKGFQDVMPTLAVPPDDVEAIIEYIKSLQ